MDSEYNALYEKYVDAIESEDNEAAHVFEDALFKKALALIAEGSAFDPKNIAAQVLYDTLTDYERWYA